MEELKQKIDLILESQIAVQSSVIKLNHKIDALDEKFEKKFEETNQRITELDEDFDENIKEIVDMFKEAYLFILCYCIMKK